MQSPPAWWRSPIGIALEAWGFHKGASYSLTLPTDAIHSFWKAIVRNETINVKWPKWFYLTPKLNQQFEEILRKADIAVPNDSWRFKGSLRSRESEPLLPPQRGSHLLCQCQRVKRFSNYSSDTKLRKLGYISGLHLSCEQNDWNCLSRWIIL